MKSYLSLIVTLGICTTTIVKQARVLGGDSSSVSEVSRKPRAVIHVGPHKTGSTTIQMFFNWNEGTLALDNFMVPHIKGFFKGKTKMVANLAFCLNPKAREAVGNWP